MSIFPDLNAVLLLESLVLLPEGVDTVNHGLDKGTPPRKKNVFFRAV